MVNWSNTKESINQPDTYVQCFWWEMIIHCTDMTLYCWSENKADLPLNVQCISTHQYQMRCSSRKQKAEKHHIYLCNYKALCLCACVCEDQSNALEHSSSLSIQQQVCSHGDRSEANAQTDERHCVPVLFYWAQYEPSLSASYVHTPALKPSLHNL